MFLFLSCTLIYIFPWKSEKIYLERWEHCLGKVGKVTLGEVGKVTLEKWENYLGKGGKVTLEKRENNLGKVGIVGKVTLKKYEKLPWKSE